MPCPYLLAELDIFSQNVVTLGTVTREVMIVIPLKDISTCNDKVFDNLKVSPVSSQMQSSPLLYTSCHVQIEIVLQVTMLTQHLVDLDDGLNALLLPLPRSYMYGRPVVIVLYIGLRSMRYQQLTYVHALLRVL